MGSRADSLDFLCLAPQLGDGRLSDLYLLLFEQRGAPFLSRRLSIACASATVGH